MAWHFSQNISELGLNVGVDADGIDALGNQALAAAGWVCKSSGTGLGGAFSANSNLMPTATAWNANAIGGNGWQRWQDPAGNTEWVFESVAGPGWNVWYSPAAHFSGGSAGVPPTAADQHQILSNTTWFTATGFLAAANDTPVINNGVSRYQVVSVGCNANTSLSGHVFVCDPIDPTLAGTFSAWDTDPQVVWAEGNTNGYANLSGSNSRFALLPAGAGGWSHVQAVKPIATQQGIADPVTGKDVALPVLWEQLTGANIYPKGYSTSLLWQITAHTNNGAMLSLVTSKDRMTVGTVSVPWNGLTPAFAFGSPTGPFNLEIGGICSSSIVSGIKPCPGETTLGAMRLQAQQRCDMVNSSFISTSEWNGMINASAQELYGLIVQKFGNDYFTQSPSSGYTFKTDGTNQFFALPCDFFKVLGVDLQVTAPNQYVALKEFNFSDRNKLSITNSTIPANGQTIRVLYVPRFTLLQNDSDSFDGFNGWEEYVVIDAARKAALKEESYELAQLLDADKAKMLERIESEAENRDASSAATTVDVYGRRARGMQYRINGNNIWLIGNGMPSWGPLGDWGNDAEMYGGLF